jgi:hypothetical protein
MSEKKTIPRQPDFAIISEEWGVAKLIDETVVKSRIIMGDLVVEREGDLFGPQVAVTASIALRVLCGSKVSELVKQRPIVTQIIPLTTEAGYERIEVAEMMVPTVSIYTFEDCRLSLRLKIDAVARNLQYRTLAGAALYNVRSRIDQEIEKVRV